MSHILLLLDHNANRTLLSGWLRQHYDVLSQEPGTVPMAPFDLCLIDGPALSRLWREVRQYKEAQDPAFLPVVLITSNHEAELLTRHLWKTVDELIRIPIEKLELQARMEILLRTRQLSQDLKLRNEELESFFYAMTHDVRAPLRAIKSFAQLLQEEEAWQMGEQGQQDLKQIQSAAGQMQETIDGLIAFARVERSHRQMQSVSLAPLVQSCLHQLLPEIQQRQAQVVVDESLPTVQGTPVLLTLALANLLSNALKFLPPDRRPFITVRATTSPQLCRLEIEDNGIGIPLEDQQRLFQPFVQLHGVEVYDGIGLGLATARKAVELMGGRIGVISTVGQGSTFWIELQRGA
ncbi:MAG TPA: HAMP domain-containing sensor histidine kinase [Ktedonosporobacter sp.]|nr:HAMP domain-containing sensor histidine kinase [Ktedonosporobacter sp.]